MSETESVLYRFGVYEADPASGELRRAGRLVRLQPQPFTVLLALLKAGGAVVSREELQRLLWGDETFVDFDQGLNTCIRQIRLALGDSAESPRYVQTLQRRGYRFLVPVEAVPRTPQQVATAPREPVRDSGAADRAPAHSVEPVPPDASPPSSSTVHRAFRWPLAVAVVLLAIAGGALISTRLSGGDEAEAEAEGIRSLAVLPLADLSPDGSQDYMADGLTEALIADLSRIKALRVISRTSAMHYKNTRKRVSEIARELNVQAVIEGSVAVSGSRIRLTTQLIDARTEAPLWSATYDRELQDILTLQQELARSVATEIRVRMTAPERERLANAGPVNPDAYREYLRGRAQWNRRTPDSLRAALRHFQRAVELDPSYAAAYSGQAQTYMLLGDDEFSVMEPEEALQETRSAATRALGLDPGDAGAWAALATVEYAFAWNWTDAGRYFERALVLAPGDATVHHWYAWYLISLGRLDEAVSTMAVARDLNPLSPIILTDAGYPHLFAGRPADAIRQYEAALVQDPNFVQAHLGIGRAHEVAGDYAAARRRFERAVVLSDRSTPPLTFLGRTLALQGDRRGALAVIEELRQRSRSEYVPPLAYAWIYTAMGEQEAALDWLERAVDKRSATTPLLLIMPELQSLAGYPRFEALVARLQTERILGTPLAADSGAAAAGDPRSGVESHR